jgi:hypothetical protein
MMKARRWLALAPVAGARPCLTAIAVRSRSSIDPRYGHLPEQIQ